MGESVDYNYAAYQHHRYSIKPTASTYLPSSTRNCAPCSNCSDYYCPKYDLPVNTTIPRVYCPTTPNPQLQRPATCATATTITTTPIPRLQPTAPCADYNPTRMVKSDVKRRAVGQSGTYRGRSDGSSWFGSRALGLGGGGLGFGLGLGFEVVRGVRA